LLLTSPSILHRQGSAIHLSRFTPTTPTMAAQSGQYKSFIHRDNIVHRSCTNGTQTSVAVSLRGACGIKNQDTKSGHYFLRRTYYMVCKVFNNVGFNDKCDSNTQSCLRVFNIISAYAMSRFYREIYHTWCKGWSFSVESGIGFIATSLLNQTSSPTLPTVPDMNLCPKVNLAVAKFRNRSCLFVPVILAGITVTFP
jgi:hypothetical protein